MNDHCSCLSRCREKRCSKLEIVLFRDIQQLYHPQSGSNVVIGRCEDFDHDKLIVWIQSLDDLVLSLVQNEVLLSNDNILFLIGENVIVLLLRSSSQGIFSNQKVQEFMYTAYIAFYPINRLDIMHSVAKLEW